MAIAVQLKGKTQINVGAPGADLGQGTGLTAGLGWSRNGVTVFFEPFYLDVPGDERGGDDGPPIEVQWLGGICRGRLDLTKFERTVLEEMLALIPDTGWGNHSESAPTKTVGQLMFTGAATFEISLETKIVGSTGRFFPRCIIRAPAEHNYSSKYSNPVLEFEAHENGAGLLHGTGVKVVGAPVG